MRFFKSKKQKLIHKWIERADERERAADKFRDENNHWRADVSQMMSDVFRLCADELSKL